MALVGSGVTFSESTVVTPGVMSSAVSSCTASVGVGTWVVRASSSWSGAPVVTMSALISVSGFDVVASGMGVGSSVDEAGMLVT